jgi:hypothetical protein
MKILAFFFTKLHKSYLKIEKLLCLFLSVHFEEVITYILSLEK